MDTKLKRITIISLFMVALIVNVARSQTFKLHQINGEVAEVSMVLDESKQCLSISSFNDTVKVDDVANIKYSKILGNNFFMVAYEVRAGSGLLEVQTLILSIWKNKIVQSLNCTTEFDEEFIDFSKRIKPAKISVKSNYKVDISLSGSSSNNYKLKASVSDIRKSLNDPGSNYTRHSVTNLDFDKKLNLFCSSRQHLSKYYTIADARSRTETKQRLNGIFPTIRLGKYIYYYINGFWYGKTDSNYLTQLSY